MEKKTITQELLEKQMNLLSEMSEKTTDGTQLANLSDAMVKVGALLISTDVKHLAGMYQDI